jgi:hypothetical protein
VIPTEAAPLLKRRVATLSIGDVALRLSSADAGLVLGLPPAMVPFERDGGRLDATIEARWGPLEQAAALPVAFDSGGVWTLKRSAGELVFEFRAPLFGDVPYKVGRFLEDFSTGEVVLRRQCFASRDVYPLEYPLDELVFTNLLAERNGVELHGCGVADGDEGLLFVGFSGAGKSTIARLWSRVPGATVLSDDRIILRPCEGGVLMHGTPWHGDEALVAKGPVPLSRIFVLHHGRACAVRSLARPAAAAALFARCFAPFHSERAIGSTLATLEQTTRVVPCVDLWFSPDAATVDFIRATR